MNLKQLTMPYGNVKVTDNTDHTPYVKMDLVSSREMLYLDNPKDWIKLLNT